MLLRRALIVVGGGFILAAGLGVVVVMMTLPRWVLTVVMTSPRDMLQKRVTVDEAEAARICLGVKVFFAVSLGLQNDQWRAFLAQMQEGDELWIFCSPAESWEHMAGRGGIAVVRHGKVVGTFVTLRQ